MIKYTIIKIKIKILNEIFREFYINLIMEVLYTDLVTSKKSNISFVRTLET